jgi:hypothetical protein
MPNFREFQRDGSYSKRKRPGETVTIQRRGLISFSDGTYARLGSPKDVAFLVDRDKRLIGFRRCKPCERNAHAVRGPQRLVSAIPVLKAMGVYLAESRRYSLHVEDGQPPYIDLNEDAPVVTSNRRKA